MMELPYSPVWSRIGLYYVKFSPMFQRTVQSRLLRKWGFKSGIMMLRDLP